MRTLICNGCGCDCQGSYNYRTDTNGYNLVLCDDCAYCFDEPSVEDVDKAAVNAGIEAASYYASCDSMGNYC